MTGTKEGYTVLRPYVKRAYRLPRDLAASVLSAVLIGILSGCQTFPVQNFGTGNDRLPEEAISLSKEAMDIVSTAEDPASTIPENVNIVPRAGSWTARFAELGLKIIEEQSAASTIGYLYGANIQSTAMLYGNSGNRDKIVQFQKRLLLKEEILEIEKKSRNPSLLAEDCADPEKGGIISTFSGYPISCAPTISTLVALTSLRRLTGDHAGADDGFKHYSRYAQRVMQLANRVKESDYMPVGSFFRRYATDLILQGDLGTAVSVLREDQKNRTRLDTDEVSFDLEPFSFSGRDRSFFRLVNMISDHRELDNISAVGFMVFQFDAALVRGEASRLLKSRLRSIWHIGQKYSKASQGFRNQLALDIDCRSGILYQLEGHTATAKKLYEKVQSIFLVSSRNVGRELGLCLMNLASRVGNQADLNKITASMERQRAVEKEVWLKNVDKRIAAWVSIQEDADRQAVLDTNKRIVASLGAQKALSDIAIGPRAPLFQGEARFRSTLAQSLEFTKADSMAGSRGSWIDVMLSLALLRNQLMARD